MKALHTVALFFLLATTLSCSSQQPGWLGEWGTFDSPLGAIGERLSISACDATGCAFNIDIENPAGHCSTTLPAKFTFNSASDATATLPGQKAQTCKLQLHRDTSPSTITVSAGGDACTAYYCTSSASFAHTFPQRSSTTYTGQHANACLTHSSPAILATCTDATLSKLEDQWRDLYTDYPLQPTSDHHTASFKEVAKADLALLAACDAAANPATCLHDRLTADIVAMTSRKDAVDQSTTARGDPAQGAALSRKIAGRYRHRFANGDVSGRHYTSTDTMTITPVGAASIHFDITLNFYNGHECGISGGALYRKNGSFVFDDDAKNKVGDEPLCRLAITPTDKGVSFKDLTGGCKMYCGARGTLDGASFNFTERITTK